jgi:hypothetical protein
MHHRIEGQRHLLTEEMLRYFGETCPALAERYEIAIVGLPPLGRREAAGWLQTLCAVSKETNRKLRLLASQPARDTLRLNFWIVHSHQSSISARWRRPGPGHRCIWRAW